MDRRKMLGSVALAGITAAMPFKNMLAQAVPAKETAYKYVPFKRFMLGELELTIVSDGHILQKPVQPNFAPGIPTEEVANLLRDNFRSTEEVDLGMQILLIKKGNRVIMVDSGMGKLAPTTGLLIQALQTTGITPGQVTDIVISHAHPDHVGGLLNTDGSFVFNKATLYIAKVEYDFWMKATAADFKNSVLKDEPEFLNQILVMTKKTLTTIKPKLRFFTAGETLFDCIKLVAAPGHTPGLTLMQVFSGDQQLLHVADLIHSDVILFAHPEWGYGGDTDLTIAAQSRVKILKQLAEDKMLTLSYHLPWPGLGHVRKKGTAFEWVPEVYAMP